MVIDVTSKSGLAGSSPVSGSSPTNRWFVLGVLLAMNIMLTLDKTIFLILLEPLKREFQLNDLMLGSLSGSAFAVCMGVATLPLGALADRTSRRNLAAACLTIWSAMTMLGGAAQTFVQLLLARMTVGIGEAGGAPSALSIIGDLFEHKRRATAMSIFALGAPSATVITLSVGTSIVHDYGWRIGLIAAGAPGLLVALVLMLFVREPLRSGASTATRDTQDVPKLVNALRIVFAIPAYVHLVAGVCLSFTVLAGASTFTNSFLVRLHHVKLNEIGPYLGLLMAAVGFTASASVGIIVDWLAARDERWRGWVMAIGAVCSTLFGWIFLTAASLPIVIGGVALFAASATCWMGPAYSLCHSLVPARMQGKALAAMLLIGNTGGYIIGPALAGFVSDRLHPVVGEDGLRYAMLGIVTLNLWAAVHFLLMARRLPVDLTISGAS